MGWQDQLFKTVFRHFLPDLLELVAPELAALLDTADAELIEQEAFTDFPHGERVEADLVAKVRTREAQPRLVLVHLEAEDEFRLTMDERALRYFMHLRLKYGERVVTVVVFLQGGPAGVEVREVVDAVGPVEICRFRYLALGLSRCLAEEWVDRPQPLAAALSALMRSKSWDAVEHKLRCLKAISRAKLDAARRFLLANVVETYVELDPEQEERFTAEAVREAETDKELKAMIITWEDALAAREAKGHSEGRSEGRAVGRVEGRTVGRVEGEGVLLAWQAEKKFGSLGEAVEARLRCADEATLRIWAERLLTADRLEDVFGTP